VHAKGFLEDAPAGAGGDVDDEIQQSLLFSRLDGLQG
jgi:hypothetical protein